MLIALALKQWGIRDRQLYLYDTYEGMSEPTENDVAHTGATAAKLLDEQNKDVQESVWCYSSIDEVRSNLSLTGYPSDKIFFIKGKVEDTLLHQIPGKISLLRLDTDWYESTKIELEVLYPLLESKGILIIDDFGFWEGAKKAVVEYFERMQYKIFLNRIDFTGRLMIKP